MSLDFRGVYFLKTMMTVVIVSNVTIELYAPYACVATARCPYYSSLVYCIFYYYSIAGLEHIISNRL